VRIVYIESVLSNTTVGAFLGSGITSFYGETLGRRKSIAIGVVVMIIGAIPQATSYGHAQMIIAHVVAGIGMSFINNTVPVFQSEFSLKVFSRHVRVYANLHLRLWYLPIILDRLSFFIIRFQLCL